MRRVFRIWPAFAVVITLAAALRFAVGFGPLGEPSESFLSSRYLEWWTTPFHLNDLLQTFWFNAPGSRVDLFDGPIWSLIVEMRVSLIFPIIIVAVNRFKSPGGTAALMVCAWAAGLVSGHLHVGTGTMVPSFLIGALLAVHFGRNREVASSWPTRSTVLLLAGGLIVYTVGALLMLSSHGSGREPLAMAPFFAGLQLVSFGSAMLILVCLHSRRLGRLLLNPVLQFMGLTSYSFYLVHRVVIFGLMRFFIPRFPDNTSGAVVVTYTLSLGASYLLAFVLHRYVELPGNALGKRLSLRIP